MKLSSMNELFFDQLKDLYSAENQLIKALPKMAKGATSEQLRQAITDHLEETRGQAERLQKIGEMLGLKLTGKKCQAMEGLIEEGKEVLETEGADPIIDLAIIAAAQRVEHYEISAYGSAKAIAEQLGHREAVELLQQTLQEESSADEKLTQIAAQDLYPEAKQDGGEEEQGNGQANKKGRSKVGVGK